MPESAAPTIADTRFVENDDGDYTLVRNGDDEEIGTLARSDFAAIAEGVDAVFNEGDTDASFPDFEDSTVEMAQHPLFGFVAFPEDIDEPTPENSTLIGDPEEFLALAESEGVYSS